MSDLWAVGSWLSAALDDPSVCDEMKADINAWFEGGGSIRPLTPPDHAELARLAEAATHKSWAAFTDDSGGRPHTNLVSFDPVTDCALSIPGAHKNDPNIAFIAAANPARVLDLLAEIAALRVDLAKTERDYSELRDSYDAVVAKLAVERAHGTKQSVRATQAERQRDEAVEVIEEFMHARTDKAEAMAMAWIASMEPKT